MATSQGGTIGMIGVFDLELAEPVVAITVPKDADAATIAALIRAHIDGQKLILVDEDSMWKGDASKSIADYWVFILRQGMGDLHYVYVDRKGDASTYQEIS